MDFVGDSLELFEGLGVEVFRSRDVSFDVFDAFFLGAQLLLAEEFLVEVRARFYDMALQTFLQLFYLELQEMGC